MLGNKQANKLVSVGTYETLTDLLYKLEHVKSPKEIVRMQESLRSFCTTLFTHKEIFELHDDHILDLAETIAGLYPEFGNLEDYIYHILGYLEKQISKHEQKSRLYSQKLKKKIKEQGTDPDGYLDLKYKTWTYTDGYYCQQANMYRLLQGTLRDILYYDRKGLLCQQKPEKKKKGKKKAKAQSTQI